MIVTLTVRLVSGRYAEEGWEADIEIDEDSSLDELHNAILRAVRFEDDHDYEFYIARDAYSNKKQQVGDSDEYYDDTPIKKAFPLPAKHSLFYLFDWGDSWIFKIIRSRKAPQEPVKRRKYPRVVSTAGVRPKQYDPENY